MRACVLHSPAPVESAPLELLEAEIPEPRAGEVLVRVRACGVCRTDLHVIEGELAPRRRPLIPGHQAVGVVERSGPGASLYPAGARVGVAWLHRTCGLCRFCASERENLCIAPEFSGYTVDGGFAEYLRVPESFAYPVPDAFADAEAAPLLCAGIIGFRCLRLSGVARGARLGLYGFGAAAHIAIQVARHWGVEVYVSTRHERHRNLALELGARWAAGATEAPPVPLDAAIIFAPAGELVPAALAALDRGAAVILGGIHMSPIPPLPYELLYHERVIRSVANNTRADGRDFLRVAAGIPIRTRIELFDLDAANQALRALKHDAVRGAAVLQLQ
ncbi:MAG: zinc-dependent alcohol dehydrogenase family protein [Acidobacteria bacterium]|nr:zinc-dependent alcohol dehydrogenase family protein [Acidobacteriota bacterium]